MDQETPRWIQELPAELAGQRVLLDRLLTLCRTDDELHWLVIGCSLARGGPLVGPGHRHGPGCR
jgi:hypothetical protein